MMKKYGIWKLFLQKKLITKILKLL